MFFDFDINMVDTRSVTLSLKNTSTNFNCMFSRVCGPQIGKERELRYELSTVGGPWSEVVTLPT